MHNILIADDHAVVHLGGTGHRDLTFGMREDLPDPGFEVEDAGRDIEFVWRFADGRFERLGAFAHRPIEATVVFDAGHDEIRVLSRMESYPTLIRVVNIVGDWLEQERVDFAKLSLGTRSCTLYGTGST